MRGLNKISALVMAIAILPCSAFAQSIQDIQALSPEDRKAYMQSMSEDERAAMKQKWRAEYAALPAAEQQAMRDQRRANGDRRGKDREAMREQMASLSPEERETAKTEMRAKKDAKREERRARWDAMSEEERAAVVDRRKNREGGKRGKQGKREASNDEPSGS